MLKNNEYTQLDNEDSIKIANINLDKIMAVKIIQAKKFSLDMEQSSTFEELYAREELYKCKVEWAKGNSENAVYEVQFKKMKLTNRDEYKQKILEKEKKARQIYLTLVSVFDTLRIKATNMIKKHKWQEFQDFTEEIKLINEKTSVEKVLKMLDS